MAAKLGSSHLLAYYTQVIPVDEAPHLKLVKKLHEIHKTVGSELHKMGQELSRIQKSNIRLFRYIR